MLQFLETAGNPVAEVQSWVDWARNPHRTDTTNSSPTPIAEVAPTTPPEPAPMPYVPIGQSRRNTGNRRCRCGSLQHLTVAHRLCPLNARLWGVGDHHNLDRLNLYVPRSLVREYHVGTALQMFPGKCVGVTDDGFLKLEFDDGDTDNVEEDTLLKIFGDMRKQRAGKRRRVSSTPSGNKRMR